MPPSMQLLFHLYAFRHAANTVELDLLHLSDAPLSWIDDVSRRLLGLQESHILPDGLIDRGKRPEVEFIILEDRQTDLFW